MLFWAEGGERVTEGQKNIVVVAVYRPCDDRQLQQNCSSNPSIARSLPRALASRLLSLLFASRRQPLRTTCVCVYRSLYPIVGDSVSLRLAYDNKDKALNQPTNQQWGRRLRMGKTRTKMGKNKSQDEKSSSFYYCTSTPNPLWYL